MGFLDAARQVKHGAFLVRKRSRPARVACRGAVWRAWDAVRPFRFDVNRYRDARGFYPFDFFLHRVAPDGWVAEDLAPVRRLWCVWAGHNPMTDNRRRSLDVLRQRNPDLDVVVVTPENLDEFLVEGHPLHPAYEHLSAVHRSDYLRAYLLHHHGGAYADIKSMGHGLAPALDAVSRPGGPWVVGYPEIDADLVDNLHGPIGQDVRHNHHRIVGIVAMAARPRTPFTAEWLAEVERRLSYHREDLVAHPAEDPYGGEGDYPVTWIGIGADVFEPLQLKYLSHVEPRTELTPVMQNYR